MSHLLLLQLLILLKKIGNTTLATIKQIKELRKPAISDDAMNIVLTASDTPKTGNGFFYV